MLLLQFLQNETSLGLKESERVWTFLQCSHPPRTRSPRPDMCSLNLLHRPSPRHNHRRTPSSTLSTGEMHLLRPFPPPQLSIRMQETSLLLVSEITVSNFERKQIRLAKSCIASSKWIIEANSMREKKSNTVGEKLIRPCWEFVKKPFHFFEARTHDSVWIVDFRSIRPFRRKSTSKCCYKATAAAEEARAKADCRGLREDGWDQSIQRGMTIPFSFACQICLPQVEDDDADAFKFDYEKSTLSTEKETPILQAGSGSPINQNNIDLLLINGETFWRKWF